jgi:RimJ/RimL family protein N-acetyltransferase
LIFERTQDLELVRSILTHPRVYPWVGDDFSPAAEDFRPNPDPRIWYVIVRAEKVLGLLLFLQQSTILWEVHIAMLPGGWGRATEAAVGGFRWLFANAPAVRIVGTIPVSNRLACSLAERSGMIQFGLNPKSILRGGQLQDMKLYGISRN